MQFSSIFTLLVAGVSMAAPVVERDAASAAVVNAAFTAINGRVVDLDNAVKAFNGDLDGVFDASQVSPQPR